MGDPKSEPHPTCPCFFLDATRMRKIMHYYQFNIDGYRAATAHLTNDEDLAYRRLLDMYYDTEDKIPLETEWVARRLRLACEVVTAVLMDMFVKHEDGWFHPVCDENIKHYQAMAEKNRANGRLGGRRKKPSGLPVETDSEPNAKATNNYEPITKNHKPNIETPVGVSDEVWQDFIKHRKTKKAQVTERVINEIAKQAEIAGWTLEDALKETVVRNWQSFKAEWVIEKLTASEERRNTLAALTRGLAVPKPAPKQFWEKQTEQEIGHVEPKRLL